MSKPRRLTEPRGWAFGFCILLVEPILLLLTKRRWSGGENIPASGGCVLVSNHISHVDPFTFAHFVYDHGRLVRFLAKAEVLAIPVLGRIVAAAGQIPVQRLTQHASQAFDAAVDAVGRGECVAVYPEGTLTRQPELWPMTGKTGAARIALASGAPVIPIAQWGAHQMLAPYGRTPRLLPRKTITMTAGPPVDLDDLRGREITPELLGVATERIMEQVTRLLADIRQETPPTQRFDPRAAGVQPIGDPRRRGRDDRRSTA